MQRLIGTLGLTLTLGIMPGAVLCAAEGTEPVAVLRDGTAHQALFSIALDHDDGVAVGAGGAILETKDGGKHWSALAAPVTKLALLGVDMRGAVRLAVGQSGIVLRKDGAGAWTAYAGGTANRLFGVSLNPRGLAIAVGAFGTIAKSVDSARSWQILKVNWDAFVEPGTEPHLYAVHVEDDGTITIVGEFGLILRSTDGGSKWQLLHKGDASLLALELRSDGVGFAVGQNGAVLRSTDKGVTWTPIETHTKAILLGVHSSPGGRVYVTAMRDMLASNDDGASWRHLTGTDFAVSWYAAVTATPTDQGVIAVGHAGRVLRIGM